MLFVDLETYSDADLPEVGLYRYTEDPSFAILLMAYAWDDDPVTVADVTADGIPAEVRQALTDPSVVKVAHNAAFERTCLSRALSTPMPINEWEDTMVLALYNGLPGKLEDCALALGLDQKKDKAGESLIRYFSRPGKNGRRYPEDSPERWERFKAYCGQDVEVERAIWRCPSSTRVTAAERRIREVDDEIARRGVLIDVDFARSCIALDRRNREKVEAELMRLTGLSNPNSVSQIKAWLSARGLAVGSLDKTAVAGLLASDLPEDVKTVLRLRQELGKTSTAKYQKMLDCVCTDGRVRGILQYYGASRTGRWAGRLLQVQNLPQNHLDDIEVVRALAKVGDAEALETILPSLPDTLSQLIRTAIVAPEGKILLVADYHAIEAVCIAYLSGEAWRLKVFATHGKIYEASYSQAFGVPFESVKKGSPERQKGKIMELALGYGGGSNALLAAGADELGLSLDELQTLVDRWRAASPAITGLWSACERAAKRAIANPAVRYPVRAAGRTICHYVGTVAALLLILPSGRRLSYRDARVDDDGISYMAQNQATRKGERTRKWERTRTWGGRLVENLIQAFARDILAEATVRLTEAGYPIVFHVHDEIITEMPIGSRWEDMAEIMAAPISWAPGLEQYLHADGYETPFYRKD